MFFFGLSNGVAAGSKETVYQTSHDTSHDTLRGTSKGTSRSTTRTTTWTTSRGTSRTTTWTTYWTSGWTTTYNTTNSYNGQTSWNTSKLTSVITIKDTLKGTYHLTAKITTKSTSRPRVCLENMYVNQYPTLKNADYYFILVDGNAGTNSRGVSNISLKGTSNSAATGAGYAAVNAYMWKGRQHGCKWAMLMVKPPSTVTIDAVTTNNFDAVTYTSSYPQISARAGDFQYVEYNNLPTIYSETYMGTFGWPYYFEYCEVPSLKSLKWDQYPYGDANTQLYSEANNFAKSIYQYISIWGVNTDQVWTGTIRPIAFGIKHPPAGGFSCLQSQRIYDLTMLHAPEIGIRGGKISDGGTMRRFYWEGTFGNVMHFPRIYGTYGAQYYGSYFPTVNSEDKWNYPYISYRYHCPSMQTYRDTSNLPYKMKASDEWRFQIVEFNKGDSSYHAFKVTLPLSMPIPDFDLAQPAAAAFPMNAVYNTIYDTSWTANVYTNYNTVIKTSKTTTWGTWWPTTISTTKTTTFATSHPTTATAQTSSSTSGGTSWTTYWSTSRPTTYTTSWTTTWNTTVSTVYSTLYNTSHITVG